MSGPPIIGVNPDENLNYDSNGEINRLYYSADGNIVYSHYFQANRLDIGAGSLNIRIENFQIGDYGILFMSSPVILAWEWEIGIWPDDVIELYEENPSGQAALEAFQNDPVTFKLRASDNSLVTSQRAAATTAQPDIPSYSFLIEGDDTSQTIAGNDVAETIRGGGGNDVLQAVGGSDILFGDDGADRLIGGSGADQLDGGAGVDMADYRTSGAAVQVNLFAHSGLGGDAEGDTLVLIENLAGSQFGDVLTGDDAVNRLQGFDGNDQLQGGGGNDRLLGGLGADVINGGDGVDTADYSNSLAAVSVNLKLNMGQGADAAGDTFVAIENLSGSDFNDTLTGDDLNNRLSGVDGNDTLIGHGGIDYLVGGTGNDVMTGGAGADVFVFNLGSGLDMITDFWAGAGRTDRIQFLDGQLGTFAAVIAQATDTAAGVAIAISADDSLTLSGVQISQLRADDFLFA